MQATPCSVCRRIHHRLLRSLSLFSALARLAPALPVRDQSGKVAASQPRPAKPPLSSLLRQATAQLAALVATHFSVGACCTRLEQPICPL
ncbi:hypothetical protein BJY59DRAFT_701026 [Rhodotorula toruloides]